MQNFKKFGVPVWTSTRGKIMNLTLTESLKPSPALHDLNYRKWDLALRGVKAKPKVSTDC